MMLSRGARAGPLHTSLSAGGQSRYVAGGDVSRAFLRAPVNPADTPAPSALPDIAVVQAMARGEEPAATMLYDRHAAAMYGLALRMVGEPADAEEVVLDAFAQAWREASRFDGSRGSVLGWLTTITRTRALDFIRARGRRVRATDAAGVALDEPAAMGSGHAAPDALVQDAETAQVVHAALQRLSPPQRQAIELAFYEGLTHHEVAARLQQPLGTVKTRIRQGLLKLRESLQGMSPERLA